MKSGAKKYFKLVLCTVALSAFLAFQSRAADHAGPGPTETQSKLWLVGDSSLHAYSSTAHNWTAEFGLSPDKQVFDQLAAGRLQKLEVIVPVAEMKSGKNQLDKNLQKALKAEANRNIAFHMEKFEVAASTVQAGTFMIKATGLLEIAGEKKQVTLDGTLTREGTGARIQGVEELLMTDYGVKPPKILMIKTSNEVKVHYDVWLDETGKLK